jgi:hypothetical protein
MLELKIVRSESEALKDLGDFIEKEVHTANEKIDNVIESERYDSATVYFLDNYKQYCDEFTDGENRNLLQFGTGAPPAFIFEVNKDEMGIVFLVEQIGFYLPTRETNLAGHIAAHEIGQICQGGKFGYRNLVGNPVFDDETISFMAAWRLSDTLYEELNTELLCLKAGYVEEVLEHSYSEVSQLFNQSVEEEVCDEFVTCSREEEENAYMLLNSYWPIFLEAYRKEIIDQNLDGKYIGKIDSTKEIYFENASNMLGKDYLDFLKEKSKEFVEDECYQSRYGTDSFVVSVIEFLRS